MDRTLDWHPRHDERSRLHQVRPLLEAGRRLRRRRPGPTLDQGREGACTGFGAAHVLNSLPFKHTFTNEDARQIYLEAKERDEWAGSDYEGSSVLGAMQALKDRGLIVGYKWIGAGSGTAIDDLIDTLRYFGDVEAGTYWYPSMHDTDPSGILEVDDTAKDYGGHAYHLVDAVYRKLPGHGKKRLWIKGQNSWGNNFGVEGGFFYVNPEDMEKLLHKQGEAAVPLR